MSEKIARTLNETAARLSVSRRSIYREIEAGRLRAVKIGGRTMILAEDEVAYLTSRPQVRHADAP